MRISGAVFLYLILGAHETFRQVVGRGTDHRHRRAQFVRNSRYKFHLQTRQPAGALRRDNDQRHTDGQQRQHAEAQEQIAAPVGGHDGFERAALVARQ